MLPEFSRYGFVDDVFGRSKYTIELGEFSSEGSSEEGVITVSSVLSRTTQIEGAGSLAPSSFGLRVYSPSFTSNGESTTHFLNSIIKERLSTIEGSSSIYVGNVSTIGSYIDVLGTSRWGGHEHEYDDSFFASFEFSSLGFVGGSTPTIGIPSDVLYEDSYKAVSFSTTSYENNHLVKTNSTSSGSSVAVFGKDHLQSALTRIQGTSSLIGSRNITSNSSFMGNGTSSWGGYHYEYSNAYFTDFEFACETFIVDSTEARGIEHDIFYEDAFTVDALSASDFNVDKVIAAEINVEGITTTVFDNHQLVNSFYSAEGFADTSFRLNYIRYADFHSEGSSYFVPQGNRFVVTIARAYGVAEASWVTTVILAHMDFSAYRTIRPVEVRSTIKRGEYGVATQIR